MKRLISAKGSSCAACSLVFVLLLTGCASRSASPFAGLSHEQARAVAQQLALRRDQQCNAY